MAATAAGGGPVEVALVSVAEAGSASSSSSSSALPGGCWCWAWEVGSGVPVAGYRGGGSCSPHGLALLGGERLLGAQLGKSCLGAWELQRKDQLQQKIICPGVVTCLAAAPNGLYVLAGIAESIYLWEVSSGNLLAILNRHYQDLSCLAFTDDSSHFLSGAKDSLVIVWNLSSVLQAEHSPNPEPRHVWTRHSLPITDLCCGVGGPVARAATASLDQTAKLWEISSGGLLLSVVFDVGIMSVTLDPAEYGLFCGGMDGSIFHVDLCSWPVQRERNFQTERENGKVFKGHRDQVTCLSVSTDGNLLLSGSNDETVRLWDIQSKQCIRTINYKGIRSELFGESRAAVFADVLDQREDLAGRPRAAEDPADGAGGGGQHPAQGQQGPLPLLQPHPHQAGQVKPLPKPDLRVRRRTPCQEATRGGPGAVSEAIAENLENCLPPPFCSHAL
ncbi:WD repeat-containing protein 18 isoform X3 [Hemicordylus capensis]|uniref:WD repeat-containing protein 18 isoform X3 n=1 Tax=Hemicordylus capensis TaxID=884348 RepID=UPI0023022BAE|nr:WD repeat-containing protein 18 isoform X3 [Hemicordylus capensis]